jgi:hypothetical protein
MHVARPSVVPWHVPDHVGLEEATKSVEIAGSESVRGP